MNTFWVLLPVVGKVVLHSLWQGTVTAIVVAGLLMVARRSTPYVRYGIAVSGLLLLAVSIVTTAVVLSSQPGAIAAADTATASSIISQAADAEQVSSGVALPALIGCIWAVGFTLMTIRLAGGLARLRRWYAERLPAPISVERVFARLAHNLRLNRVQVVLCEHVDVPFVSGCFCATVFLPLGWIHDLTADQVQALLAHELMHVRRHDYFVNLFQVMMESICFYHPATWWLSSVIRQEREFCCDDAVVSLLKDPLGYASALTAMEELRVKTEWLAPAATGGNLKQRVERIMRPSSPRRPSSHGPAWVTIAVLATVVTTAVAALPRQSPAVSQDKSKQLERTDVTPIDPTDPPTIKVQDRLATPVADPTAPAISTSRAARSRSSAIAQDPLVLQKAKDVDEAKSNHGNDLLVQKQRELARAEERVARLEKQLLEEEARMCGKVTARDERAYSLLRLQTDRAIDDITAARDRKQSADVQKLELFRKRIAEQQNAAADQSERAKSQYAQAIAELEAARAKDSVSRNGNADKARLRYDIALKDLGAAQSKNSDNRSDSAAKGNPNQTEEWKRLSQDQREEIARLQADNAKAQYAKAVKDFEAALLTQLPSKAANGDAKRQLEKYIRDYEESDRQNRRDKAVAAHNARLQYMRAINELGIASSKPYINQSEDARKDLERSTAAIGDANSALVREHLAAAARINAESTRAQNALNEPQHGRAAANRAAAFPPSGNRQAAPAAASNDQSEILRRLDAMHAELRSLRATLQKMQSAPKPPVPSGNSRSSNPVPPAPVKTPKAPGHASSGWTAPKGAAVEWRTPNVRPQPAKVEWRSSRSTAPSAPLPTISVTGNRSAMMGITPTGSRMSGLTSAAPLSVRGVITTTSPLASVSGVTVLPTTAATSPGRALSITTSDNAPVNAAAAPTTVITGRQLSLKYHLAPAGAAPLSTPRPLPRATTIRPIQVPRFEDPAGSAKDAKPAPATVEPAKGAALPVTVDAPKPAEAPTKPKR